MPLVGGYLVHMNTTSRLRRYLSPILGGTFLGLVIAGSSLVYEADMVRAFIGGDTTVTAPADASAPYAGIVQVMAENDCWTGDAPADMKGVIPGHVVVSRDGEVRLGGAPAVSKAFQQLFDGADHGLTIHAFCR